MFSYLRAHHKRAGSTPTSPASPSYRSTPAEVRSPDQPPVLPPIPRVTSTRLEPANGNADGPIVVEPIVVEPIVVEPDSTLLGHDARPATDSPRDLRPSLSPVASERAASDSAVADPPPRRPHTSGGLTGLRRGGQAASPLLLSPSMSMEGALPDSENRGALSLPLPLNAFHTRLDNGAGPAVSSVTAPHDKPAGVQPPHHSIYSSQTNLQQKSGKKGLHLRNPMSLLLRRRSGQMLELSDEALISHRTPPLPDKEPWIRGTGVHDFSAPRPTRNYSYNNTPTIPSSAGLGAGQNQLLQQVGERVEGTPTVSEDQRGKIEREHTPIFKEHLEDDADPATRHSRVTAESLANQDFLARNSFQPSTHESFVPHFAKQKRISLQSPPTVPRDLKNEANVISPPVLSKELPPLPPQSSSTDQPDPVALPPVMEDDPSGGKELSPKQRKPSQASSRTRSRAFSGSEASLNGLPAHMNSRASRFSFQYGGSDSALQELMLEEKHKEKEAAKRRAAAENPLDDQMAEEGEDMYDYDDMDGADEFGFSEEPIPGTEDDDDYFSGHRMQQVNEGPVNGSGFYMQGLNKGIENVTLNTELPNTQQSRVISQHEHHSRQDSTMDNKSDTERNTTEGLGLVGLQVEPSETLPPASATELDLVGSSIEHTMDSSEDDDLYFDDGLIGEANYQVGHFNEDVFDDPSHPLYERKPQEYEVSPRQQTGADGTSPLLATIIEDGQPPVITANQAISLGASRDSGPAPFGDIDAYHKALAQAATKAAADGRFKLGEGTRHDSEAEESEGPTSSYPSGLPDTSLMSRDISLSTLGFGSALEDDYEADLDDFGCATEDDPIIAAANAEALANDYDGFYGQEFGFFAAAHGESELSNGGYFGERGVDLNRKKSLREPNLTPITERSEYSHRNSFVSLHRFSDNGPLPSPGLAQLALMSPYGFDDDEMTFSQLRRLRKDAFGGSDSGSRSGKSSPVNWTSSPSHAFARTSKQTYSASVGSSPNQLPMGWNSGNGSSENITGEPVHRGGPFEFSSDPRDGSDYAPHCDNSSPIQPRASHHLSLSSPLQTIPAPHFKSSPPQPPLWQQQPVPQQDQQLQQDRLSQLHTIQTQFPHQPQSHVQQNHYAPPHSPSLVHSSNSTSTVSSNTTITGPSESPRPWRKSHTRNSASADSVTYVKERQSDTGDFRWVLERRRTAETGELELIAREVVEGGRI